MMTVKKKKMKTKNKFEYLSPLEAVHQSAHGLYDAGVIDATTMREFDELCLPSIKELTPNQIKKKSVCVKN